MSANDAQLGPDEAQNNFSVESSLGVPFPEFDVSLEFADTNMTAEDGVSILSYWDGSSIPFVDATPSDNLGGPGRPLVIIQSRKRASFF